MSKHLIITIVMVVAIGIGAAIAVMLVKGYSFSPTEKRLVGTGIISATSLPDGASVYIDGHLTTATNATIPSLPPKKYMVKIQREGFIPWEKEIEVKEGVVLPIKATLFPAIPTIYPLTFNGVIDPILSEDGQKLAFSVPMSDNHPTRQRGGVWVWTMGSQPISFSRSAEPRQILTSATALDFSKAELRWSPDSKQLLIILKEGKIVSRSYLISVDQTTSVNDLRDITPTLTTLFRTWEEEQKLKDDARILSIKDSAMQQIASNAASLLWSPDETKFIAGGIKVTPTPTPLKPTKETATNQKVDEDKRIVLSGYKVYDLTDNSSYDLPEGLKYFWLPNSLHVILEQEDVVEIVEFDGKNVAEIYAGSFEKGAVFPWPDSSRLVVVSSYPTRTASSNNLFGINLK